MGTRYTFVTEALDTEIHADRIKKLEEAFRNDKENNPDYFEFWKLSVGKLTFFCGYNKNSGGGFYEYARFETDIRVVWIDDEGGNGDY